uniref:DDE-1 domain-containing protein n=1 Tax=Eptatretus burgeri TaxID=7764 RepID=A0A8C4QAG2_EPTBU
MFLCSAHTTRQPKYLMYKPFCWKACDMIAKCSCGLQQSWLSFDSMASHLALNPNHNSKTCSLSDDTELSNGEAVAASTKRKIQSTTITEDEKASKESKHNVKELCIMQNNQNLPTKPVKVENAVERKCDVLTQGASTSIYDDIVMVELGSDNEMDMLLDKPNKMSSWKWIKSTNPPKTPGQLNPQYCETQEVAETIQAANDAVDTFMGQKTRKRKRGDYNTYDDKLRAKIAHSALEIGVACTVKKFQKQLGRPINESTVRGLRAAYLKKKKENPEKTIKSLPKKPRGSPLLLGEKYDGMLKDWMKQVQLNGGVINRSIVMAVAEGILLKHDKTKLSQYGGTLQITEAWARSLLTRLGFGKRKGTKDVKKLPQDFPDIQAEFVKRVSDVVKEYKIPDDLIINWGQTGICMVPGGDWTVKKRRSRQGTISGIDDKCKLTVLLAVSKVGTMLPPQLIYTGKTDRCHPKINFPAGWDVTHTKSHCGTNEFMLRYVDKIIIPYAKKTRKDLKLPPTQKCLTIFDFFKVHEGEDLLTKLRRNNIFAVFVPACCTERLQPLDLSVNKEYKDELKRCFHSWYASQVMSLLGEVTGKRNQQVVVNMKTAILKPIHACWLIKCHEEIGKRRELIKAGFVKAGL